MPISPKLHFRHPTHSSWSCHIYVKTNIKYGVRTLSKTKSVITKCERNFQRRFELNIISCKISEANRFKRLIEIGKYSCWLDNICIMQFIISFGTTHALLFVGGLSPTFCKFWKTYNKTYRFSTTWPMKSRTSQSKWYKVMSKPDNFLWIHFFKLKIIINKYLVVITV